MTRGQGSVCTVQTPGRSRSEPAGESGRDRVPRTLSLVRRSSPVGGFRLAYERVGAGVLLHGWPGNHADYQAVTPVLSDRADVLAPDVRGFGASDKHREDPGAAYSADAQARSLLGLMDELGLDSPVVAEYDIGSRVAQAIARTAPERIRAIVLCPPLPGAGERVLSPGAQREFWYQAFRQLDLAAELIDGNGSATHAYLRHFWTHWSGPAYRHPEAALKRLLELYEPPGAFTASIGWYRAGSARSRPVSRTCRPTERADLRAHHSPLAGPRLALSASLERSPGPVLQRRDVAAPLRGWALRSARGAGGVRRRDSAGARVGAIRATA
jgi:pimeloyl-ACP methyl ester carboxylesterase